MGCVLNYTQTRGYGSKNAYKHTQTRGYGSENAYIWSPKDPERHKKKNAIRKRIHKKKNPLYMFCLFWAGSYASPLTTHTKHIGFVEPGILGPIYFIEIYFIVILGRYVQDRLCFQVTLASWLPAGCLLGASALAPQDSSRYSDLGPTPGSLLAVVRAGQRLNLFEIHSLTRLA